MDAANVNRVRSGWLAILLVLALGPPLRAEVFELEGGGRIEGEWINREERPLTKYQVRRQGVLVTLPLAQVIDVVRRSPAELAYAQKAPATADTVEAQWELADWCRTSGLPNQRKVHLQRVIELDSNHRRARAALGYVFQNGKWTTQEAIRRADGYELYRGKWRTPQEIEILEADSRTDITQKDWLARLTRLRRDLDEPGKAKAALETLAAIKDPLAIGPLGQMFSRERARSVKALYTDLLLGMVASDPSLQPRVLPLLVFQAMRDKDIEVFYYIVDKLALQKHPLVTEGFAERLASASNEDVNRAGEALGKLQDKSAISPLIEALITKHQQIRRGAGANATTTGFVDGNSFFKQGDETQIIIVSVQNQHVLAALGKLTGVDFGFEQKAWRSWHAQEKIAQETKQPAVDVRRQ
jgi:PBS lyase HEAT-like repeat